MEKSNKKELLDSIIGMDVESGSKLCKENGYVVRIIREDSINYMGSMDPPLEIRSFAKKYKTTNHVYKMESSRLDIKGVFFNTDN